MPAINYAKYQIALESLYTDRATIQRQQEVVKPNKATDVVPVTVYESQPCRISQAGMPKDGQTEAQNDIDYVAKLFISPDVVILQGDTVTVQRGGVVRSYQAGEPVPYPTHQEVSLRREGYA